MGNNPPGEVREDPPPTSHSQRSASDPIGSASEPSTVPEPKWKRELREHPGYGDEPWDENASAACFSHAIRRSLEINQANVAKAKRDAPPTSANPHKILKRAGRNDAIDAGNKDHELIEKYEKDVQFATFNVNPDIVNGDPNAEAREPPQYHQEYFCHWRSPKEGFNAKDIHRLLTEAIEKEDYDMCSGPGGVCTLIWCNGDYWVTVCDYGDTEWALACADLLIDARNLVVAILNEDDGFWRDGFGGEVGRTDQQKVNDQKKICIKNSAVYTPEAIGFTFFNLNPMFRVHLYYRFPAERLLCNEEGLQGDAIGPAKTQKWYQENYYGIKDWDAEPEPDDNKNAQQGPKPGPKPGPNAHQPKPVYADPSKVLHNTGKGLGRKEGYHGPDLDQYPLEDRLSPEQLDKYYEERRHNEMRALGMTQDYLTPKPKPTSFPHLTIINQNERWRKAQMNATRTASRSLPTDEEGRPITTGKPKDSKSKPTGKATTTKKKQSSEDDEESKTTGSATTTKNTKQSTQDDEESKTTEKATPTNTRDNDSANPTGTLSNSIVLPIPSAKPPTPTADVEDEPEESNASPPDSEAPTGSKTEEAKPTTMETRTREPSSSDGDAEKPSKTSAADVPRVSPTASRERE